MSRYDRDEYSQEDLHEFGNLSNRSSAKSPPQGSCDERGRTGGNEDQSNQLLTYGQRNHYDKPIPGAQRSKFVERGRDRAYSLRDSELRVLTDIGTFRILKRDDLVTHRYSGDAALAQRDLDHLSRQKLIEQRTSYPEKAVYVTLTKAAHRFLESQKPQDSTSKQAFYHGFVKPREARHDAAIYRLYQHESERIERSGGHVKQVILDFELKRSVNRKLAKLQSLFPSEQAEGKRQIATEHGLPVVNSKIALPDLRLEYEGPNHEAGRVDLELVTGDYHAKALRAKVQTGFTMYGLSEDAARLRPAMTDPEIMLNILSL